MNKTQKEILTDAFLEIAEKYDTCGDPNCNRIHAVIGIWADKIKLHEAIELAKKKGLDNA